MPITTDYEVFAERYHAPSEIISQTSPVAYITMIHLAEIEKLKSQVVTLREAWSAENEKLKEENERILDRGSQVASDLFIENEKLKNRYQDLLIERDNANSFIEESGGWGDFEDYVKSEFGVDS